METAHELKATNISVFNITVYVTVETRLDTIGMVKSVTALMISTKRSALTRLIQILFVLVQRMWTIFTNWSDQSIDGDTIQLISIKLWLWSSFMFYHIDKFDI